MKKHLKIGAIVGMGVLILIQIVPGTRDNPPVSADFDGPADVKTVLSTSCYDCHSNETKWPFYSRIAPVSWLIVHDVHEGRSRLNLSNWGSLDSRMKDFYTTQIYKEASEGEMPPAPYVFMHSDAKVAPSALQTLKTWSESPATPAVADPSKPN